MHRNGTVYTKNEDDETWSKYRKAGTQLYLLEDDLTTIPTSECTPTKVNTFSNNNKYCDMTTPLPVSQVERTRPVNSWEALVKEQPEWVRILLSAGKC